MSWQEPVSFAESPFEIIDGDRGKNYPKQSEFSETGHCLFLSATNVTKTGFDFSVCQFIDEKRDAALNKGKLQREDIVLTTRGTIGNTAYFNDAVPFERLRINSGMVILRCDRSRLLPAYLYHFVRSPSFFQQVNGLRSGVAQPQLPIRDMRQIKLPLPPLHIQQRIAGILSAYDDLIDNSQRRIKILEAMARALYREWFVHFRFPGHESVPRVASPLGSIPKGWDITNLDSVKAEQPHAINGGPFGSKLVSKDYVAKGVPVIRGSNLSESGRFDPTEFVFVSDEKAYELRANLAKPGDIVVTQRGTLGQLGMIPSGIGYDRFVISQSQMKITLNPKKVNREYAFFFLRSEEANQRIKNLASSSGVPHINLAVLRDFNILVPPFGLQSQFGQFAVSTEAMIEVLLQTIQNLRRTRDLLLPRLLSGQIDVEAV